MWPKFGSYPNLHVNLFSFIFELFTLFGQMIFSIGRDFYSFLGDGIPGLIFSFSSSLQLTVNMFVIKFCRWLDLNRRSLVLEAPALPTEPHQLPFLIFLLVKKCTKVNKDISQNKMSYATHKKRKQTRCQEDPLGFSGSDNAVHFFVKFLLMLFSFV